MKKPEICSYLVEVINNLQQELTDKEQTSNKTQEDYVNNQKDIELNIVTSRRTSDKVKKILIKKPEIPITEISELSGFGSLNSFIRTFKESENCTPTKFKRTKS